MADDRRAGAIARATAETSVELTIDLDGGAVEIATSIDFLDHMLEAFAKHSGCGLFVRASGDGMDNHHVIEDVGIALGKAISDALGEKRGIVRFGSAMVPLDEALIAASIDISGRPFLNFRVSFLRENLAAMPTEMIGEFFRALTDNAKDHAASGPDERARRASRLRGIVQSVRACIRDGQSAYRRDERSIDQRRARVTPSCWRSSITAAATSVRS